MEQKVKAIPHNSKCRYGERGAADAKPKAQIILDAAKVSAASGGNSEPKQGQRSQSARAFAPKHDAGTATRHYRAFWQRRCRAAAAGAVLEPLGGNCAVLPKNNRHNLTRRNAAKGCACYFMRGYRSSWSWVGISSAWSGTPVQLPSGSLWLARFSSSMVCRSWWASAGV